MLIVVFTESKLAGFIEKFGSNWCLFNCEGLFMTSNTSIDCLHKALLQG